MLEPVDITKFEEVSSPIRDFARRQWEDYFDKYADAEEFPVCEVQGFEAYGSAGKVAAVMRDVEPIILRDGDRLGCGIPEATVRRGRLFINGSGRSLPQIPPKKPESHE